MRRGRRFDPDDQPEFAGWRVLFGDFTRTMALVWQAGKLDALLIMVISVLQALMPAARLWISKLLLDAVADAIAGRLGEPGPAFQHMVGLLGLQIALTLVSNFLSTIQGSRRELFGHRLQNQIAERILRKATRLSLGQFENPASYDKLQNAYREVGSRPLGVFTQVITLGQAIITLVSVSALMFQLGPLIVPLVLLASIPGVIVSSKFGAANYRMLRWQAADARAQSYIGSLLTNDASVKEVRLFGFGEFLIGKWLEYYGKFRQQLVSLVKRRTAWDFGASILSTVMIGGATALVLLRAAAGRMSVGDFGLFIQGIGQLQGQFGNLLSGFSGIYQNLLYMRNLYEFLELEPDAGMDGETWSGQIHTIEFDEVYFRYPLTERDVLKGVSFSVRRGEMLALVGENGAGKSTVVKLLTGLYRPTSGRILFNGIDIAGYSTESLMTEMSAIFQDFGQYQMTVEENIALQHQGEGVSTEPAARSAGAHEFISRLPESYHNMLGRWFEGGVQLSGGQWQRIALARLYFHGGSVLVFDEPTSALDADAEYEVIETLRAAAAERITLVVSHRFSTVRLANHIVVIDGGVVSEAGSHEQLMEIPNGTYHRMFSKQARGYVQGYEGD